MTPQSDVVQRKTGATTQMSEAETMGPERTHTPEERQKHIDARTALLQKQVQAGKVTVLILAALLLALVGGILGLPHYWAYWKRVNADADAYYQRVVRCPTR